MKRSPMPPRKSPMKAGKSFAPRCSPLAAGGRLAPGAKGLKRSNLVPRPPVRTPAETKARKLLAARSGGVCEMDGHEPATDAHHRVNRSQGGRWEIANLLHLCHSHHMHVTVNPALAKQRGWSVRGGQNPGLAPVWIAGRGWNYLTPDGTYRPATERRAA